MNAAARRALIRAALLLPALLPGLASAGPTGPMEPELRGLLQDAVDEEAREDRTLTERWLQEMSQRLTRWIKDDEERMEFLRLLHAEAKMADLPPELVLAVIQIESGFDRYAISYAGAQGYMQIMPFWLEELDRQGDNLFNDRTNLRMGCTILRFYLDREKGHLAPALARYNGSYGRRDYADLVLKALRERWAR